MVHLKTTLRQFFSILILSILLSVSTAYGQSTEQETDSQKTDTIKLVGQLISPGVGSKIHIAEFKVLQVIQGPMLHDTIRVGYYFYTIDGELPDKAKLTLLKYQGNTDINNYYIFPNYDAGKGHKRVE